MTKLKTSLADRLRAVAEFIEAHPELPKPYITAFSGSEKVDLNYYLHLQTGTGSRTEEEQKKTARAIVQAVGGKWDKVEDGEEFSFVQVRDQIEYTVMVKRAAVCERIVIGNEEVIVPATPARPELPSRVEIREVVEWRCEPLLADKVLV